MNPEFWQSRWGEGRIGFHKSEVNPLLLKYFTALQLKKGSRVLVPLSGKSIDMAWLAQQGYEVVGIELVESAVQAFFAEQNISPTIHQHADNPAVKYYQGQLAEQTITLWVSDIFALTAEDIGNVDAVYDRAALIALLEDMRLRYSEQIRKMSGHAPQLLITLNYDQSKKDGPPFSVNSDQVQQYYGNHYQITELENEASTLNTNAALSVTEHVWLLNAANDSSELS
ncbi:thiopurine S-methyltransferase [Psychrobacter sp. H8-1]|uniref:thiopurine S-methyltransferase n=1 Tax=Psychrobacter sp. H8-1 TaxID=2774129 RepID=UPI00191B3FD1|nr:thiopurine S-methyltransferase [Psychrobacter sp. H8-1]